MSAPAGNLAALADRTVYLDPGHAGTAPPAELTADDVHRTDCIDERTCKENTSAADVVVSLHADVSGPGNTGFHLSAVTDPLPHNLADESSRLASTVRDAMVSAGLPVSNYLGADGLNPRADLSGLNLSTKPKNLIEFGNMRDTDDLAALRSREGRWQRARAVAEGLASYLS